MNKLIGAELKKIFSKKAIYIFLIIAVVYAILIGAIYKYMSKSNLFNSGNYYMNKENIKYEEDSLASLNPKLESDVTSYVDIKTDIYLINYCSSTTEWRCNMLVEEYRDLIYNYNDSLYNPNTILDKNVMEASLNLEIEKLNSVSHEDYLKRLLNDAKKNLSELETTKNTLTDKMQIEDLNSQIIYAKNKVLKYELLLDGDIENTKRTNLIESYIQSKESVDSLELKKNLSSDEEETLDFTKSDMYETKYRIDHEQYEEFTASTTLSKYCGDYVFLLVIFVTIMCSSIVSDEYHKGTIKQLLIKPYHRGTILLSKYLTILIMIPIMFLVTFIIQGVVDGILFGFDGLFDTIAAFNLNTNKLELYNTFTYVIWVFISYLPCIILLGCLSLLISTVLGSTALANCIPLLGYFFGNIFNSMIKMYNIKKMIWFPTYVWNFEPFFLGHNKHAVISSLGFNITFTIIYLVILVVIPFIVFKNKDIKNV